MIAMATNTTSFTAVPLALLPLTYKKIKNEQVKNKFSV